MRFERLFIVMLFAYSPLLVGCSEPSFSQAAGTSVSSAGGGAGGGGGASGNPDDTSNAIPNDDGSVSGAVNQDGGSQTPNPSNPANPSGPTNMPGAVEMPKVTFQTPTCMPQTNCAIIFNLKKAMPAGVSFEWETNDSLYGTPVAAGQYPYGQPSVQYIPVPWSIVSFVAGERTKTVYVQNVNRTSQAIQIGFLIRSCYYNGVPGDCSEYFAP